MTMSFSLWYSWQLLSATKRFVSSPPALFLSTNGVWFSLVTWIPSITITLSFQLFELLLSHLFGVWIQIHQIEATVWYGMILAIGLSHLAVPFYCPLQHLDCSSSCHLHICQSNCIAMIPYRRMTISKMIVIT